MSSNPRWVVLVLVAAVAALTLVSSAATATQQGSSVNEAVATATDYVRSNPAVFGVTPADVAELDVSSSYRSEHNRVTHVNLNQRFDGLEVFGAHATVNVAANRSVLFAGGSFVRDLAVAADDAELDAISAVEAAADGLDLDEPTRLRLLSLSVGGAQAAVVSDGGISEEPIPAHLGWQPTGDGLRLAWQLEIDDASDIHYWSAIVDAASGELLDVENLTIEDSHEDLADGLARGAASSSASAALASPPGTENPVNDGSSYRVLELPKESPNDGPRTLVENPADASGSPFGWHDTDGAAGAEHTITRGNNVHAYTDHNNSNSPDPGVPTVVVDEPSSAAGEYAAAGASFGPPVTAPGVAGDIVLGDDGVGVGTDGCEPYSVPAGSIALVDRGSCNFTVKVENGQNGGAAAVIVANNVGGAPFAMGGSDDDIVIPSVMISLDDGTTIKAGLPATGAVTITGADDPTEPEGGPGLDFDFPLDLTLHPHDYWEAAVTNLFFWNNVVHDVTYLYGFDEEAGNFQENNYDAGPDAGNGDGDYVRAEAQDGGGTNNANFNTGASRMQMYLWTLGEPTRDGDLENGIIIHEYGHGVSIRLTGGPTTSCLSGNEQGGEGWSDYLAISMLLDPALDDPNTPRGMGPYALFQDSRQGNGIRPRPYSRDMSIQPFTYDSIKSGGWLNGASLALPHGLGHGWASVLWDMTWDLIDKHGLNTNVYGAWDTGGNNRAIQYVIDGLKMQGCFPTLLQSARAVIAAAGALDGGEDYCTVYASFARRGLGFSAVDGTTNRNDNDEAFDTDPACRRGFLAPAAHAYGTLRTVDAGDTVPLRFSAPELSGTDVLAADNPYSRLVDCETLRTVDTSQEFITPRPIPVPTEAPGNSGLNRNSAGQYHYNWLTEAEWAGTCREVVVTREDGIQHRAFFRFTAE
jgi:hypothetical protein